MLRLFRLYCKLVSKALLAQMQYRASFCMLVLAQFVSGITEAIIPCILINRFRMVHGWTLKELAILYGIVHMGFATAEIVSRGFDKFDQVVHRGDFDRFLLRPLGTLFQVATSEVFAVKFGRFLQGFLAICWGSLQLQISIFSTEAVILFLCYLNTAALFYGVFVLQATLAFYTHESLELMHIVSYGGRKVGEYPVAIFNFFWRGFFTYLIPIACVLYYPIGLVLNLVGGPFWLAYVLPCTGLFFLFLSFQLWKIGVRHYTSTGS